MADIDSGFRLEVLSLDDLTLVTSRDNDPVLGELAPAGSLFLRQYNSGINRDGELFIKIGPLDTDWDRFLTELEIDDLVTPVTDDLTALEVKVNNIIGAGGYINSDGTFDPAALNFQLNNVTVTSGDDLLEVLNQLDAAIDVAAGFSTLGSLTDTTLTSPINSQALVFDSSSGTWINQTISVPPAGGGRLIQVSFGPIAAVSGTAVIPFTAASPSVSDGVSLWVQPLTPTLTTSTIRVSSTIVFSTSTNSMEIVATLFRDGVCIGAGVGNASSRDSAQSMSFTIYDTPNTTAPIIYQMRIGKAGGNGTWYINTFSNISAPLGGVLENNAFTVEEIGT